MGSNRKNKGNRSHQFQGGSHVVGASASASISSNSSSSGNANQKIFNNSIGNNGKRNGRSLPMPTVLQTSHSAGSASTQQADPVSFSSPIWMADVLEEEPLLLQTTTLRISCKDIMTVGLILLALFGVSMIVGLAAGLSVSVHLHDTVDYSSENRIIPQQRVTISDPSISMLNNNPTIGGGAGLGRSRVQALHNLPAGATMADVLAFYDEWTDQMVIADDPTLQAANPPVDQSSTHSMPLPPNMGSLDDWVRSKPTLCSDGTTIGYDSWNSLVSAVEDVNRYSAERFELWHDYFVKVVQAQEAAAECSVVNKDCRAPHTFDEDWMYYEEQIIMTICPRAVLRKRSRGPIFVNTESMVFECDDCTIQAHGTHMSFGPEAKNVLVRGITFKHATTSSLVFYYDGAEVSFENCHFFDSRARMKTWGAIADVNSTAIVNFYRCSVTQPFGRIREQSSSLSIRAGP